MITLTSHELLELLTLSPHAVRLYIYILATNKNTTNYEISTICTTLNFSKRTLYRCIKELHLYIQHTTSGDSISISLYSSSATGDNFSVTDGTGERDIKGISNRERILSNKNNIINSLSCATGDNTSATGGTGNRNDYELSDEFYQNLENMGIRVDDKLRELVEFIGCYEATNIYQRVMWDSTIRKPATIFLREAGKVADEKRKEIREQDKYRPKYFTVRNTRSETLETIHKRYSTNFHYCASYWGYTDAEIEQYLKECTPEK